MKNHSLSRSVFISATTRGLGPVRREIALALRKQGLTPVEQRESFDPASTKVRRQIEDELAQVDGVICLVGPYYGEPLEPVKENLSCRVSYTQWECLTALRRGEEHCRLYMFDDKFFGGSEKIDPKAEINPKIPDSHFFHEWQMKFREHLKSTGHPRVTIDSEVGLWRELATIPWNTWPGQ